MIVINIAMENGPFIDGLPGFTYYYTIYHWIGLRENLNRKPWFLPSNGSGFPVNFPIIQFYEYIHYP